MSAQSRLIGLDALRGGLALAVVLHHYFQLAGMRYMGAAWLAVDAFFMLSGLVLGINYEEKIKNGLTFKDFLYVRLVRLYPMYFIGLLMGFFSFAIGTGLENHEPFDWPFRLFASVFLIPFPISLQSDLQGLTPVFFFNDPSWSLFFELFVNLVFFFFIFYFSSRLKILLLIVFALGFLASLVFLGLSNGYSSHNFWGGFFRVGFFFFIGFYVYKLPPVDFKVQPLGVMALFVSLLLVFNLRNTYILLFGLFFLTPITVWCFYLIRFPVGGLLETLLRRMGDISYPLYITHYPLFKLITFFSCANERMTVLDVLSTAIFAIIFSYFLSRFEPRIRDLFKRILGVCVGSGARHVS